MSDGSGFLTLKEPLWSSDGVPGEPQAGVTHKKDPVIRELELLIPPTNLREEEGEVCRLSSIKILQQVELMSVQVGKHVHVLGGWCTPVLWGQSFWAGPPPVYLFIWMCLYPFTIPFPHFFFFLLRYNSCI